MTPKMRVVELFKITMLLYLINLFAITVTVMVRAQTENQTTLRIAVPPKSGFTQFVKIIKDPETGQRNFSGFAIEVFNQAVSSTVDTSISFEFIPFERADGTMNGSYDDMVEAVFNKEYDGAVGDITIRFSRTRWVDFTVAYTDIGISMLIPVKQQTSNKDTNALISLTPGTVIGTFVVFFLSILVFVGGDIVDLVFGRTRNGPNQLNRPTDGADVNEINRFKENEAAWRREMLGTVKGARLMMLLWFLILLYLITYYATCLISLLTKEQSITPNKSLNQIIRTSERVGYSSGSFVYDLLKEVGIPDKQLSPYHSELELFDMLSKGASEGGVTVVIDETPPLAVFLARHCGNYTLVSIPSLHSSGYGFAFQRGSNMVQQVSNGIVKITDSGQLEKIKARTIGDVGTCDVDPSTNVVVPNIVDPNFPKLFKACAIISAAVLAIQYAVHISSSNRRCLKYLYS